MSIKNIVADFAGQSSVQPRIVKMTTDDTFSTITTANYLKSAIAQGYTFYPTDVFVISDVNHQSQFFTTTITSTSITLTPLAQEVVLPVVSGNFAMFTGTSGALDDTGLSPSNAAKTKVVMADSSTSSGVMAVFTDAAGTIGDGPLIANRILSSTLTTPDVSSNLIAFDVEVTSAALTGGTPVALYASGTGKQYKLRALWLNSGGTNFSGGGGDRLLDITDGTTVYSQIPAASLQTLPGNVTWGDTELPFPASAAINTSTAAAENLRAIYSGGAADYTAGDVVISGIVERVA